MRILSFDNSICTEGLAFVIKKDPIGAFAEYEIYFALKDYFRYEWWEETELYLYPLDIIEFYPQSEKIAQQ